MKRETPSGPSSIPHSAFPIPHWKDVAAGLLLALLTLAFFWRTLSGDVYQPADGGDLVSFLYPTYRFAAATLARGELPLWNPTLYGGAPFIADIQAGFLYPPNLLLFWLKPDFGYVWMQWLSIGHLWWAGLGVYVLARVLGISRPSALLAGVVFQFSDPLLIHLGNLNLIGVLSWLGWVLAAFHLSLERRSLAWAGIAGLLFAIGNYAGHAQSSYYLGLGVAIYWGLGIGDWGLGIGNGGRGTGDWGLFHSVRYPLVTALVAALLTAPLLLPSLELLPYTERAALAYQENVGYSLAPLPALMGMITPGFFGRGPALHWSYWDRVELPYAGVVSLLLALAVFFLPLDEKRRRLLPWIGLALFGLLVSLGVYAPLHGWLTKLLPGFDSFRAPARAIVLWTFATALLAGYGIDGLRNGERGMRNAECGMRNGERGMRNAECGMRNAECGMRNAECGMRNAEWGGERTHYALRTTHYALRSLPQMGWFRSPRHRHTGYVRFSFGLAAGFHLVFAGLAGIPCRGVGKRCMAGNVGDSQRIPPGVCERACFCRSAHSPAPARIGRDRRLHRHQRKRPGPEL